MRILFFIIALSIGYELSAQTTGKWKPLFNGINLKGWHPKITGHAYEENYGQTFRVVEGKLVVAYDQYDEFHEQFGHLFYEIPYSYYLIGVEYRFVGQQVKGGPDWAYKNSGIMVHCQPPASLLRQQDFPISIEVQLLGGDATGERSTGNLCTPGTHVVMNGQLVTAHCIDSRSRTFRGEEWVRAEVLVLGDSVIKHIINGDTVLVYEQPQIGGGVVNNYDPRYKRDGLLLRKGYIALQSESHPVEFRKVEIMDLSHYYRKPRGTK